MKHTFRVFLLTATILLLAPVLANAYDKNDPASKSCASCHTLTREEAASLFGTGVDNIIVILPGPFQGVWEVDVAVGGKTHPAYVDYAKKHLLQGQFVRFSDKQNITRARFEDLNRIDVSSISVKNAIVLGNSSAKNGIIVLTDPTCPYCIKLHGAIKEAVEKNPKAAFFIMPYPRNSANKALYDKCLAAVCDKSGKILDDIFAGKDAPPPICKSNAVDENIRLAERLKIPGTPSMVLPDGRMTSGYYSAEDLLKMFK